MANKTKGIIGFIALGIFFYLITLFAFPIYQYLWLAYVTYYFPAFSLKILGYIVLGIANASLILHLVIKKKNHPVAKPAFFMLFVFLIIMAMPLIFPEWFYSYWAI